MSTIEDQLKLEESMMARGIEAYKRAKDNAIEKGRGSETGFARRLMDEYIFPLSEILEAKVGTRGPQRYGRANGHLRQLAADKAMFIAFKVVFNSFQKQAVPASIANVIGKMVEDEIRFTKFSEKYAAYYQEIMADFKNKGTKNYRHMHRVLTHSANNNEDGWEPWAITERVDVGMRLLDIILTNTDLLVKSTSYQRGKTIIALEASQAAIDFVSKYDEAASLLHPKMMPCIIPPDPWTALDQGGYYSPELRSATRLVLTNNRHHRRILRKTDLSTVIEAVNGAQEVAWRVNNKVLDIARTVWAKNLKVGMPSNEKLQPVPSPFPDMKKDDMNEQQLKQFLEWKRYASEIYTSEKERVGQSFQTSAILRAANEYAGYEAFWYVWTLDFRGRMYTTTSGFSPQGPDLAKGMLMFREGKALGERGVFWLKVHGANKYGYDKATYEDRVKWVDERHDLFMAAAADPIEHIEAWANADKPYQFLAFLFEYKEMYNGKLVGKRPEEYVSHLPVGLDGSCNGLQHFSAMLRDARGGAATNLIPGPVPNDIYREVADVCLQKVRETDQPVMREWISFANKFGQGKLPRGVAKRPVMTMPYGSTRQSCTTYIYDAIVSEDAKHFTSLSAFQSASALTPLLWTSIGEVVVAARQGMDWLQKCSSVMSKKDLGITWRTRDGFVVHMFERKIEAVKVETILAGRYQVKVGNYTEELDKHAQRNGVAPNFVHSQDAAHLRATIIAARKEGITSLALIHDDYGTHAANTDILHRLIRQEFVRQYEEFDPLVSFRDWCEMISKSKMPEMPAKGTLDVSVVMKSDFFFG